jgi:hypothetical protein
MGLPPIKFPSSLAYAASSAANENEYVPAVEIVNVPWLFDV